MSRIIILFLLTFIYVNAYIISSIRNDIHNSCLRAQGDKTRGLNPDDEEEHNKLFDDELWDMPDFSSNVIKKNVPAKKAEIKSTPTPKSKVPTTSKISSIPTPNSNWRSAINTKSSLPSKSAAPPASIFSPKDEFSFVDLDYDDFERAMFEVEMGGMNPGIFER